MPANITPDFPIEKLARLAMSVHNAIGGMPIVVKVRGQAGILVEDGAPSEAADEGEALDSVFFGDSVKQVRVRGGRHSGTLMYASAIVDRHGRRVAAIGVVDTFGIISLKEFVARREYIDRQLQR
jgi:hypothetical protein